MRAKCRGQEDDLFPEAAEQKRARLICGGCPVLADCREHAFQVREAYGVWGGLTPQERGVPGYPA